MTLNVFLSKTRCRIGHIFCARCYAFAHGRKSRGDRGTRPPRIWRNCPPRFRHVSKC